MRMKGRHFKQDAYAGKYYPVPTPTFLTIRQILVPQQNIQWSSNNYMAGLKTVANIRHYSVASFAQ